VFLLPVVLGFSALTFSAALLPLPRFSPGFGVGVGVAVGVGVGVGFGLLSACAAGKTAKQANANSANAG